MQPLIIKDSSGKIWYESQPKQTMFHDAVLNRDKSGITEFLYGGAAKGGKSHSLRNTMHYFGLQYETLRMLLIRNTLGQLEENHIERLQYDLPDEWYSYNGQKYLVRYCTGAQLRFAYGQTRAEFKNRLGNEYDIIGVDEGVTVSMELILLLRSRLAASTKGFIPFIMITTNPGDPSAAVDSTRALKSYFIDKDFNVKFPKLVNPQNPYDPTKVLFIPANVFDNPLLIERDPGIIDRLSKLPPADRARYFEGNWDTHEGQYFSMWNVEVHVIDPFEIPNDWRKQGGGDYGNVTCMEMVARNLDGDYFFYAEHTTDGGLGTTAAAQSCYKFLERLGDLDVLTRWDVTLWAKNKLLDVKIAPAAKFEALGMKISPVSKVKQDDMNFRIWTGKHIQDLMMWDKALNEQNEDIFIRKPKLFIMRGRCPKLIETLPYLRRDPVFEDDISQDTDDDHWYEAGRNAIVGFKQPVKKAGDVDMKTKLKNRRRKSVI